MTPNSLALFRLILTILLLATAHAQTPPTPAECQARCQATFARCKRNCKPGSSAACEQTCNEILQTCKQTCEALGALQGAQTPAPSKPAGGGKEPLAAVGMKSLALQVDWMTETADTATQTTTHSYRFYRSKTNSRSELHATIALRVPDIDYSDGPFIFSLLGGTVSGPEYLEVPRRPRQRLPDTTLVSFAGTAGYSFRESREMGLIEGPDCSDSVAIDGSSPLRPGAAVSPTGSFRLAISGDRAMVEVISQTFGAAGQSTSTCPGGQTEKIRKDITVGATVTDPALFVATGLVDPACQAQVGKTTSGYSGTVRCAKATANGGQESRRLSYRIDFAK